MPPPRSRELPGITVDARPFVSEHSLEMHLVMLQAMLPAPFEIVPILVGEAAPTEGRSRARRGVWGGPETVVSISSDLSHFHDQRRPRSRWTRKPHAASRASTAPAMERGGAPAVSDPDLRRA